MGILKNHSQGGAQSILFDISHIDPVIGKTSPVNVVKTVYQVGDRRLPGAGGTDKGNLLPRFCIEADFLKYQMIPVITKIHILKLYVTPEPG